MERSNLMPMTAYPEQFESAFEIAFNDIKYLLLDGKFNLAKNIKSRSPTVSAYHFHSWLPPLKFPPLLPLKGPPLFEILGPWCPDVKGTVFFSPRAWTISKPPVAMSSFKGST
jgi:hypothetical protein